MTLTLKDIKNRTEEVGECWIWQQGTTNGQPQMKVKGLPTKLVRRMSLQMVDRAAAPGQPVEVTCDDPMCVNPAHLVPSSTKAIARRASKQGRLFSPTRAANIAAARRAQYAKLTPDGALQIKTSEEPTHILAARLQVCESTVTGVRRGRTWKDYNNPFARLGGRP